ncbi:MAG: metal ABC transporter substrate-binding protein [Bacillota bacterium]|nr:metal ABC transporter substrate-binding protein [Bacillota bacterium]
MSTQRCARTAAFVLLFLALLALGALLLRLNPLPRGIAPPPEGSPVSSGRLRVVTTVYPLYEFARQVAGEQAEVVLLLPPGAEPHDWEPTPQEVAMLRSADLFIYNGAGLEPWVTQVRKTLPARVAVVEASRGLPLLEEEGAPDPHVWLDPTLAQRQVEAIRDGLSRVDPGHGAIYAARAASYLQQLKELDRQFEEGLAAARQRAFVSSHAAFGYLARRYRLEQVPIMGLSPEAEPAPERLAELVQLCRRLGIRYVFFETLVSPRVAETLAREVGAHTLVLNPLEGLTEEELRQGKDYLAVMRENLRNLQVALGVSGLEPAQGDAR